MKANKLPTRTVQQTDHDAVFKTLARGRKVPYKLTTLQLGSLRQVGLKRGLNVRYKTLAEGVIELSAVKRSA